MHRVELKAFAEASFAAVAVAFLMHRVELKGRISSSLQNSKYPVPNAPCGVESLVSLP